MRRIQLIAVLLSYVIFLNGCISLIPKGSKVGEELTVAIRINSNNQTVEQIVAVSTEHHYFALWGAEGGSDDYIGSRTWRFYLQSQDGKRKELSFLKTKAEWVYSPWVLVKSFSHTNLWVAVIFEGSLLHREKSYYRVLCFNSSKPVYEHVINGAGDLLQVDRIKSPNSTYCLPHSEIPKFGFDPVGNQLFYNNGSSEVVFDLMNKGDNQTNQIR